MKLVSCVLLTASALAAPWYAWAAQAAAAPVTDGATLIVLDASSSMRELIKGETKINIAKRAVRELVESLPDNARLGLVVYGHRNPNDCNDIELLIPPAKLDRAAFIAAVNAITPRGRTPLSGALEFAATSLDYLKQPATVILVSDGLETCNRDPCATAARLKAAGINIVVHAVAFDLSAKEAKSIACIATATGGRFLQANDAASLKDALQVAVVAAAVAAPAKAPPPPPEAIIPVTIKAVPSALVGLAFPVGWTGPDKPGDFITLVPKGAPDGLLGNLIYTRQGSPLQVTAFVDPGEGELRYVDGHSHAVLGRAAIKITAINVTLAAPEKAVAGAAVVITWTGPNNQNDYLTIVPKGAPDGRRGAIAFTSQGSRLRVTAPGEVGAGEIRYARGLDDQVLARRAIEIVVADVTLAAPDEAVAGSAVEIAWTGPNNQNDYLTIVGKAAPDGERGAMAYLGNGSPVKVTAPAEPGPGEIRYMRGLDDVVLARRAITMVAAQVTLNAPDEVVAGSAVEIAWTGPNNRNDYLTIVGKAAPDGERGEMAYLGNGSPAKVTAPAEPGPGEIRYMRGLDDVVLARRAITLNAPKITLKAPAKSPVGEPVRIEWTGPNNRNDYLTIVPKGTPDGGSVNNGWTSSGSPVQLYPPDTAGPCEIRYVSGQSDKVLARLPIEITAAGIAP